MTHKFSTRYTEDELRWWWASELNNAELCQKLDCDPHTLWRAFKRLGLPPRSHIKRKHSHEHWERALELRNEGLLYRVIGERLGVSANRAWKYAQQQRQAEKERCLSSSTSQD